MFQIAALGNAGERVLVTGASGFIGRQVVAELCAAGGRVCCLVRRQNQTPALAALGAETILGDVTKPDTLRGLTGFGRVFHLAGVLAARRAEEFERVNVEGCRSLYDALLRSDQPPERIVHVSSIAAGGPAPGAVARREDDPEAPVSLYGRTKLAGERVARAAQDRLSVVILRPAVVYGPEDRNLLPIFKMVARGLVLRPPGRPKIYSLIHVRDLARVILYAARPDTLADGTYNVATGPPCSWEELVSHIGQTLGRTPRQLSLGRLPYVLAAWFHDVESRFAAHRPVDLLIPQKLPELFARYWNVDTGKLGALEGLKPISLAEGIRETAAWYRARGWL